LLARGLPNKLIARDGVVAVLGEVASSRSLEAAPICQQNKIPMISPSSTNPKVTETGDYIFRVCFIDPFQGTVMANLRPEAQGKRVAVFTDVSDSTKDGEILRTLHRQRRQIAWNWITTAATKFQETHRHQAANPDSVFVPATTPSAR
jgi:hypothetical protein